VKLKVKVEGIEKGQAGKDGQRASSGSSFVEKE